MKRAFPQKVKPVSSHYSADTVGQSKQAVAEVNRRARTSAAMVGLALSMGAASLLLPRQNDGAIAAEPQATEPQATIAPVDPQAAVAPPEATPAAAESTTMYRVHKGQTLWQVARKYQVSVNALAAANDLSLTSILRPGQMLAIPAGAIDQGAVVPASSESAADDLKASQDRALDSMRQQRDRLQTSLTELKMQPDAPQSAAETAASEVKPSENAAVNQASSQPSVDRATAAEVRPAPVSQPAAISSEDDVVSTYRVTSGDTLGKIADLYNIPQRVLAEANGISNPNVIAVNQVLSIPGSTVPPETIEAASAARLDPNPTAAGASSQYYPMVTVPTVPTASSPVEPPDVVTIATVPPTAEPTEAGAAATVAVASPSAAPAARPPVPESTGNPPAASNRYVENLMAEILSLRDRYRSGDRTAVQPVVVPTVTAPVQVAVNRPIARPTVPSTTSSEALQVEPRASQPSAPSPAASSATRDDTAPGALRDRLVAVAPLGAQNYSTPATGRLVSPDLPPLPNAEAYLPQGAATFNGYRWPTRGILTSSYGWRWGRMHRGIDIGAPTGTPVSAAAGGEVIFAGWNSGGYGNMVEIRHPDGTMTRYAHNSRVLVRQGQTVEQGQQISLVGSTGRSTGPNLHFEVHPPNQGAVNPIAFLPRTRD